MKLMRTNWKMKGRKMNCEYPRVRMRGAHLIFVLFLTQPQFGVMVVTNMGFIPEWSSHFQSTQFFGQTMMTCDNHSTTKVIIVFCNLLLGFILFSPTLTLSNDEQQFQLPVGYVEVSYGVKMCYAISDTYSST